MQNLQTIIWSSVFKKIINALTGLALVAFVIVHLIGNLKLLYGEPGPFNHYAHFYVELGSLLYVIELGLAAMFAFHIIMALAVWWDKKKARPENYKKSANAGPPSRKTWASKNMIYTGIVLLVFLVVHLIHFKFGPNVKDGYVYTEHGVVMWDLYRLVIEEFKKPFVVIGYTVVMILLGFHLQHGFWSSFQSLGVQHQGLKSLIYVVGILLALILAIGFLFLPLYIYFSGGAA